MLGDRHDHLAAHDLPFHMRVGIIFPDAVVAVLVNEFVWRQLLQPIVIVPAPLVQGKGLVQAALVVVDEPAGSDVHRAYKGQHS